MAPASKADKKAALDVASWLFNIVTSIGIIMVNKALMATYGFCFDKLFDFQLSVILIPNQLFNLLGPFVAAIQFNVLPLDSSEAYRSSNYDLFMF